MSDKLNETFQKHLTLLRQRLNEVVSDHKLPNYRSDNDDLTPKLESEIDAKLKSRDAKHIKTDDTIELVKPKNGKKFELDELREYVGGYIEIKKMGNWWMVLNEEGKLIGLPINPIATGMYQSVYGPHDEINGDVLMCRIDQID